MVVVSTFVPLIKGGGTFIVDWTAEALRARGHEVEVFLVPFDDDPAHLLEQMAGLRRLPVADAGERLITIRWPANIVAHPNKAAWFIHHHRIFFDLWDSEHRPFPDRPESRAMRELLRLADNRTLAECKDVFSNSQIVADRLMQFNGLKADVLYPPLPDASARGRVGEYGDFILYPSRVNPTKRQDLAIEAMAHVTSDVRLVLAGRVEGEAFADKLRRRIEELDLHERVDLRLDWVPEETMTDFLATCRAVLYVPFNEDSYGYSSLEAAAHARPIVTTRDAGGALEFVQDGRSGLVTEADPRSLAAAFDRLRLDNELARELGTGASARTEELGIGWDRVVPSLLGLAV